MAKNTGRPTQDGFEAVWTRLGSRAYCYRVPDAAEVRGRTGRLGMTRPAPSDFIVVFAGVTEFAEVKSSANPSVFPFGQLERGQKAAGVQVRTAGGIYSVYIQHLPTRAWFRIPFTLVEQTRGAGRASLRWAELEPFRWTPPA